MNKVKQFFSQITKKQWIILGAVVVVLIGIIVAIAIISSNAKNEKDVAEEDVATVNDSPEIIKKAEYEGLTIDNIILMTTKNSSTFTATVTNNTDTDKDVEDFGIVVKKGDTEITTIYAYLGEKLAPGESRDITASTGMNLSKSVADNVEYTEYDKEA